MRKHIVASCICLAACNPSQDSLLNDALKGAEATSESVGEMLRAGKVEACAHPAVKSHLSDLAMEGQDRLVPDTFSDLQVTQADIEGAKADVPEPVFSMFEAIEANASVKSMVCNVRMTIDDSDTGWNYILSPSADDPDAYIIRFVSPNEGLTLLNMASPKGFWAAHVQRIVRERAPRPVVEIDKASAGPVVDNAEVEEEQDTLTDEQAEPAQEVLVNQM